ncbi:LPS-assembly lipoprotein LptE [Candidatus Erwinia haradaeae]|uniref:LPS-assembly lipoprotein LptE n=1 Tax=Candidatus Erwinia haradaeae TaxID=1922217 RepID=A0A451DJI3_9GAMM|nr:LPS assembly lipoprotein LptE [Candidatus Erwinia haradaeae]VFP86869.1 LPS-assembly lipoprotein LptE [Candidatus Erwinia haradaeae]
MQALLISLFLSFSIWIMSGCGYHPYRATAIPCEMKTLILDTEDPYGPLATTMYEALRSHGIRVITRENKNIKLSSLRLQKEDITRNTLSIFSDGKTSEYSIRMTILIQVVIPNKGIYPITSTISRSFFDHPYAPLAKDTEQHIIINDMRIQAVENLIRQFSNIYYTADNAVTNFYNN